MDETWFRSIIKGASWFSIRFVTLLIITYYIMGNIIDAGTLTTIYYSIGVFLYIFHERIWNRINFGRKNNGIQLTK